MDAGQHYERSRLRLVPLLEEVAPAEWEIPVAACPGWRVRDVLAHVVGNVEDALAGRISGPPSEAQTAEQVERHRGDEPADLLRWWTEAAPGFEAAITELGALPAAIDLLSHEHDIRHALGRPGGRDDELVAVVAELLLSRLAPPLGLRAPPFEVFRAALGRRSLDQVRAMAWTGDPAEAIGTFFVFGPAAAPLVE